MVLIAEEQRAEPPRSQSRRRNFTNFLLSDEPVVFNPEEFVCSTPQPCLHVPNGDFVGPHGCAESCSNQHTGDAFAGLGEFTYYLPVGVHSYGLNQYAHLYFQ